MKYYLAILLTMPVLASATGLRTLPADSNASAIISAFNSSLETENAVALFALNSNRLTAAAISAITPLIIRSRYVPSIRFILEGHSDATGLKNDNLLLSLKRARAVRDYMIERGVRPEKIDIHAFGEVRAAINTQNPAELVLDRRVVISALKSNAPSSRSIAMKGK